MKNFEYYLEVSRSQKLKEELKKKESSLVFKGKDRNEDLLKKAKIDSIKNKMEKASKSDKQAQKKVQQEFEKAMNQNDLEKVKELLKDGRVDPSADDNYAIQQASEDGHLDVVKELLKDRRVDPSASDNDAIRYASRNGRLDVVKELLKDRRVRSTAKKEDIDKSMWKNLKKDFPDLFI